MCEKKFDSRSNLNRHQITIHEGRKDYVCDMCEKKFTQKVNLLFHQRTVHEGRKDYACDKCEKKFRRKADLFWHQKTVHEGSNDFACDMCEKKFDSRSNLNRHQITIHEGRKDYVCDKCEKKFGQKVNLLFHQRTVHEGRKDYACDKCEKKFVRNAGLFWHQKTVHEGSKDFACDTCEKKFANKSTLFRHKMTVHEGRKDYPCNICEKKFGLLSHLRRHQNTVHEGRNDFECDKCEKKFRDKQQMLRHQKILHEGRKDFECDECEKKFGQKQHLIVHKKIVHEGRKDFECDKCEKKFGDKQHMLRHQRALHEGRKDFACDKCERKFGLKQNLIVHKKIVHKGRKDFECDKSKKKFGDKQQMLRHQRILHEGPITGHLNSEVMAVSLKHGGRVGQTAIVQGDHKLNREEMDLLLSDALKHDDFGSRFLSFVLETGYKDEPELDEAGKPVLRRTTPVHHARSRDVFGWETTIRKLFKIYDRFDANHTDESGLTHFHVACELGIGDVVAKYLDQGQDPDCLPRKSDSVDPPLHLALANDERNVVSLLLRHGADPNSANEAGETPLHVICRRQYDDDELAKIFFGTKAKLDVRDKRGNTPLHLALVNYRMKLVELLLRQGADPNVPNEEGSTPLHVICESHRFHHFMEKLFDVCDEVRRPLRVDARDESGRTPLHLALDRGAEDKAELLLRRGRADPNSADNDGSSPLHVICTRGDADYFAELFFKINDELGQRVRIDSLDRFGRTPLQLAVAKIFPGLVEILLDRGADLSKFVFPTEDHFEESLETFEDKEKTDIKFEIASDMLEVLECLEKSGYELKRSDALTLIKFFVKHGLFEISRDLDERWYDAKRFAKRAKKITVKSDLSLYDLVRLRPKEATKLLTVTRYCELAYSDELRELRPARSREACMTQLSEKMWRGFFRRWTPEFLFALARRRLPIPCCDLIFDRLTMQDWLRLCLAEFCELFFGYRGKTLREQKNMRQALLRSCGCAETAQQSPRAASLLWHSRHSCTAILPSVQQKKNITIWPMRMRRPTMMSCACAELSLMRMRRPN
ncbi:unnamed protein product [Trichogramma brassicae]|uniref:C2H2-type domain-containing protein n=1 Tax=Trichogramma brassicae TaxID=86971 RepID=A0A6H5IM75_9HYME|nr:unnamed protein product [Trichogramma brassicae]